MPRFFSFYGADYETEHCKYLISCKLIICSESIAKGPFYFVRILVSSIHHIVSFHWSEHFTMFYKGVYLPCVFALAELEKITENTRIGKPNSDIPIQFLPTKSHRVWLSFNFRLFGAHHSAIFSTPVLRESFYRNFSVFTIDHWSYIAFLLRCVFKILRPFFS